MIWLLFDLLAVSLYDLRTRRIPNWFTQPLILAGMIAHFPGHMDLWLACFLLVSTWASGWIGTGNTRLWMVVLWALPDSNIRSLILLVLLSFPLTGIIQVLWWLIQRQPASGIKTPAVWWIILSALLYAFCPTAVRWRLVEAATILPFDPVWKSLEGMVSDRTGLAFLINYGFDSLIEEIRAYIRKVDRGF